MNASSETFGSRVKRARHARGLTQAKLAKLSGVTQGLISQIEQDINDGSTHIVAIGVALQVPITWLASGQGAMDDPVSASGQSNISAVDIRARVPIISWVQAGAWSEVIDLHQPGEADDWQMTTRAVSSSSFALRVHGDSMSLDLSRA